ncbi:hypothetical protein CFIMG_005173RA [Ceratocystis fimbriata CBS 114723]|uniref:Calcium channel YVC1-like C-terminal transmembrane domain-containing protein n=1 Tax=Ceratocystis fimbriata CBS 114723 TaxID=1035309 RepID=A0A2C5X0A3_9PEZI|nr:hypothetical protein CFIMG_005173RA [Ceratocystis fimbriata CBS 114723]
MPIKVKMRRPREPSPTPPPIASSPGQLPDIDDDDTFHVVIKKLSRYLNETIRVPSSFEQLRTTVAGDCVQSLVEHLSVACHNRCIVNALLALKWHYDAQDEDRGVSLSRGYVCEIVAWRFLARLSVKETVDFCLHEIDEEDQDHYDNSDTQSDGDNDNTSEDTQVQHLALAHHDEEANEVSPLLSQSQHYGSVSSRRGGVSTRPGSSSKRYELVGALSRLTMSSTHMDDDHDGPFQDPTGPFRGLNALEIAAISNSKRFLSHSVVQKLINGIWNGDIVFWDSLDVNATKMPRFYNPSQNDPFSRLRVPKYAKAWEVFFFLTFLCLYYAVMMERNPTSISGKEALLYVWIASFFYDEISAWIDAGSIFYTSDVWNMFDMVMIFIALVFIAVRSLGLYYHDAKIIEFSFDILAIEALFMVPRICSILSLSPYWGSLIPCIREMARDFCKFMVLVVIVYLGFLTTFSLIAREVYTLPHMTMMLTKIFFGNTGVGFDAMDKIDPVFGPPLMFTFVILSNFLLMGSLTGMLSNSFSRIITHANEEYLYVYSIYVLEASTSNRLTHFLPPFNLIALVIFRPIRLFLKSDSRFRAARIVLLKATHWPVVCIIKVYEALFGDGTSVSFSGLKGPVPTRGLSVKSKPPARLGRPTSSGLQAPPPATAVTQGSTHAPVAQSNAALEARVVDLTAKIDQLMDLVQAMQEQQLSSSPSGGN